MYSPFVAPQARQSPLHQAFGTAHKNRVAQAAWGLVQEARDLASRGTIPDAEARRVAEDLHRWYHAWRRSNAAQQGAEAGDSPL